MGRDSTSRKVSLGRLTIEHGLLTARLILHARNEGKVVRMMPELMQRAPEQ